MGKIEFPGQRSDGRCRRIRRQPDQHLVPYIAVLIRRQLPAAGATKQLRTGTAAPALVELRIDDAERRRGGDAGDRRRADDDHGMLGPARLMRAVFIAAVLVAAAHAAATAAPGIAARASAAVIARVDDEGADLAAADDDPAAAPSTRPRALRGVGHGGQRHRGDHRYERKRQPRERCRSGPSGR